MRKPYCIDGDESHRTLQDYVELIALGIADEIIRSEKTEKIQIECKILDSLTKALKVTKN
jgi:hypothetical protein